MRWHPKEGERRLSSSVAERPDWVLSRQRSWGINIPAFYCIDCGEVLLDSRVIRHVAEIFKQETSDAWHIREVKELLPEGTRCPKCGGTNFRKEMDILDVWFDSGASSILVLEKHGLPWPCDMYLEGSDQHRGWFNAALIMGVSLRGDCPYRTCITHGFTLDKHGRAMHTSLGNVVHPNDIVEKYGADVLRLWVASSDYTVDVRMGDEILERLVESYRKIRNTYRFLLGNLSDFDPEQHRVPYEELWPLERFMLHRLERFKTDVTRAYEEFEFHKVFHRYYNFVVVDLSAFYLDVLKDRLYTWNRDSKARRGAQQVMHEILKTLMVTFAPILAHTTEEVGKHFKGAHPEGVMFERWPEPVPEHRDPAIAAEFERLLEVREEVFIAIERMRKDEKLISDRLEARVHVLAKDPDLRGILEKYREHLPELFIVSQVELAESEKHDLPLTHEGEGLWIGVEKARGEKCPRCWMYSPDIGRDPEYPEVCPKCVRALRGEGT